MLYFILNKNNIIFFKDGWTSIIKIKIQTGRIIIIILIFKKEFRRGVSIDK